MTHADCPWAHHGNARESLFSLSRAVGAVHASADPVRTATQVMRVRAWDRNVRAGWMPVANGRKRMILPTE